MILDPATDLTVFIIQDGARLVTDSRSVAVAFGKRHKNVLRTIDAMRANPEPEIAEHARLSFEPSSYVNAQGKQQPIYRMTKEGMAELTTVYIEGDAGRPMTELRAVAIAFGKQHAHVMRTIQATLASDEPEIIEHAQSNFGLCSYDDGFGRRRPIRSKNRRLAERAEHNFVFSGYTDPSGRKLPIYLITAKGLSALALGFTGEQAEEVRIRFVNSFEDVANRLANHERSITEQLHALTRREAPSELKDKIGSRLMNEHKAEKPELVAQRMSLEAPLEELQRRHACQYGCEVLRTPQRRTAAAPPWRLRFSRAGTDGNGPRCCDTSAP